MRLSHRDSSIVATSVTTTSKSTENTMAVQDCSSIRMRGAIPRCVTNDLSCSGITNEVINRTAKIRFIVSETAGREPVSEKCYVTRVNSFKTHEKIHYFWVRIWKTQILLVRRYLNSGPNIPDGYIWRTTQTVTEHRTWRFW